jgi:hypothetical protein
MAWRVGCSQRCHEGWRPLGTPKGSASRPARGTAVPPNMALYRGPASASDCAGLEERGRDETTAQVPVPATLEAMLIGRAILSLAPRSTMLSNLNSDIGTSGGRWGQKPRL